VGGGNALIREGIHAKYGVNYVTIPVSRLQVGANTITLVQGRSAGRGDHVMYDYLSLEMP
jgi:rhamnogalacturonan endolyase